MKKRILIAECKQEVSTFNPHLSGLSDFGIRRGSELIRYHRTVRNEIGGALQVFDQHDDIELVPTYSAFFITSGGTLSKPAWEQISTDFIDSLSSAVDIDGIYFCMHGAMASEQELDPEGWLLEKTRAIFDPKVPIVVSLDLHGILTQRMLLNSNAIVAYHTYPHIDFFETGARAAHLLCRILNENVRPVTAVVPIPALVRGDELITANGSIKHAIDASLVAEQQPPGLSAGLFIGNPFTDVPELQSYAFVVSDHDEQFAQEHALLIADLFWQHHEKMRMPLISLEQLSREMAKPSQGTTAIVDAADATSSGASGDSNAILRQLRGSSYQGRLLLPIVDPRCVQDAISAGLGNEVSSHIGGALDPQRFVPLPIRGTVRHLADQPFRSESFGELWYSGPTAVIESENATIVVGSRAVNLYDRSYFYAHGQNPGTFDAVVVKSPHCQHHMYAAWCSRMLHVDAPGSSSANLPYLGHTRCPRPIFPLDQDVEFHPRPLLYR